jgi:hypothetical protein
MMIHFTEKELQIIRDAVEAEGFIVPEDEINDYAMIVDKIDTMFEETHVRNNNES